MPHIKAYKQNEIIVKEGDTDQKIFVLISGTVAVYKNNKKISEYSNEGTILGEISPILNIPRTTTLKASSDTELYVYDYPIDELITLHPDFAIKLLKTIAARLVEATEKII
ncbi:Crp/Fnr family transcriptional regulator [Melioribacteraceae bacterium 4301-Me]|uniref:Crp/Fnr family transcriptional regulator n=1 Tax=Pyranulibacter aquaticus TaxID=3163344 RepID=UPI0035960931